MTTGVGIVAALTAVFHLATARIYGYHRDEFYYLAGGRRPAWGYVDHPPLTPLLYWLSDKVFGVSTFGLRIVPALLHGAAVIVVALLAKELGGDQRSQFIAAIAVAFAPLFVTTGHFLGTVTVELLAGSAACLFLAKLMNGGDPRWWLAVGAVFGLGLFNKWTLAAFIAALGLAIVFSAQRSMLATPWVLGGTAVALACAAPTVWWQARHDWPQLKFASEIRDYGEALMTVPAQFLVLGAASVLLALPGLLWMLRDPVGQQYRAFAIAFLVVLVVVMVSGGKPYYTAAAIPVLLASGAVAQQDWKSWTLPAWLIGVGLLTLPFSTPLLPQSTANVVLGLNPEIGEMLGWEHYVDAVADVHAQHPGATILTSNYSEAGAIELLGVDRGLPQPISGHVTYWYWGHPGARSPVTIATGFSRDYLLRFFENCDAVATIETPGGVENEENGTTVWRCTGQREDWDTIWPQLQHY